MQKIYSSEFASHLDKMGVKYTCHDNGKLFEINVRGDNLKNISVLVFFIDDDYPYVHIRCYSIANFNGKKRAGIEVCNRLNEQYRWVKFYIAEEFNDDLMATIDAEINVDTCGAECFNMVLRIVQVVDEVYPQIEKARWL